MDKLITFGFISSHRGGQHTNGPDYGIVTGAHDLTGVRVEVQTRSGFGPHKARSLITALIDLAVQEIEPAARLKGKDHE